MKPLFGVKTCLFVVCCVASALAQDEPVAQTAQTVRHCANTEAEQAIEIFAYDNLHTWNDIYRSFKKFAHCDDGAISEGFSGRIGWLLVYDWQHVSDLNHFVRLNPSFKPFVISHIDGMTSFKEWQLVQRNARQRCPAGAHALCRAIDKTIARLKKD